MPEAAFDIPEQPGAGPQGVGEELHSDVSSLQDAAHELTERREGIARPAREDREVLEVDYRKSDGSHYPEGGKLHGQRGIERAAEDLNRMRTAIGERRQEQDSAQVRLYQDYIRQGLRPDEAAAAVTALADPGGPRQLELGPQQTTQTQPAQQQVQWPQNANQQQAPQQQINWSDAESIKAASPAIEAQRQQYYDSLAQLDRAIIEANQEGKDTTQLIAQRNQHAALTNEITRQTHIYQHSLNVLWQAAQNGQDVMYATVISQCPELAHVAHDANQVAAVMATLEQQNPQRAMEIRNGLARLKGGLENVQQLHQAAWQANIDQFKREAQAQDKLWESWNPDLTSNPVKATEAANQCASMLLALGLTVDDIKVHYNSNSLMRSAVGQQVLRWASAYFNAVHGAGSKRVRPTPPRVMRPGSLADRSTDAELSHSDSDKRLNETGSIRDATKLLLARRAGRRT